MDRWVKNWNKERLAKRVEISTRNERGNRRVAFGTIRPKFIVDPLKKDALWINIKGTRFDVPLLRRISRWPDTKEKSSSH